MFDPQTAQFLHALASPNRQAILMLFATGKSLNVSEIAEQVGLSLPTISIHLRELRTAGLLTSVKRGKQVHYAPNVERIRAQLATLSSYLESCC